MMEQWFIDAIAWYESNCKFLGFAGLAIGGVMGMLGTLIFGPNYKQRIAGLGR